MHKDENAKPDVIIVGLGSTAEHVYRFIREYDLYNVAGFAADREYVRQDRLFGLPVHALDDLSSAVDKSRDFLFLAMLWDRLNAGRRKVYTRLKGQGYRFANLISPTARIRGCLAGDNCWFHDYAIVQHGAQIGADVMAMAFSLVGAHAVVGSHCFIGARATVAGNCRVGEQSFVGINATVFDDRTVGRKCIVGACAAVKRDLPDCSVCKTATDSMDIKTYDENVIEDKLQFKLNRH